jgi:hypothetical protein|tara:strand:+ start:2841 stop:3269 length:429 start_codon:yes stop_codon:yes gene_type:complete
MIQTTQNRNRTYSLIVDNLPAKRQQIYQLILQEYPCSPQELLQKYSESLKNISRNVAMRFTELREYGYIVEYGTYINDTGHSCARYRPTSKEERIEIIDKKYQELVDKKDKLVSDLIKNLSPLTKEIVVKEVKKIDNQLNNL